MSFSFNKTARTATAVVISSLSLTGMAFAAFQSGVDVGKYCTATGYPGESALVFGSCCNGGCGSIHPIGEPGTGYADCVGKCKAQQPVPIVIGID